MMAVLVPMTSRVVDDHYVKAAFLDNVVYFVISFTKPFLPRFCIAAHP